MHYVVFTVEVIYIYISGLSSLHSLDKVLCGKYLNMVDVNELTMANFLSSLYSNARRVEYNGLAHSKSSFEVINYCDVDVISQ